MKTLYLMCGISFSGKSTLAAAIARKWNGALVSLDEINRERGVGFGGDGVSVEEWEKTHAVALTRLDAHMQSGGDIVVDDTNCFRWIRDRFRAAAAKNGYRSVVVHLDIPEPVLRERMRRNEATGTRQPIREDIFRTLAGQFEAPAADETTLRFTGTDEAEKWIETNLEA